MLTWRAGVEHSCTGTSQRPRLVRSPRVRWSLPYARAMNARTVPQTEGAIGMSDILTLAVTYSDAWSRHNPQAIAALHTEDSVFHVHNILDAYVGRAAIAEAAAAFFADSSDLAFERERNHLGDDHIVSEYVMSYEGRRLLFRPAAEPITQPAMELVSV